VQGEASFIFRAETQMHRGKPPLFFAQRRRGAGGSLLYFSRKDAEALGKASFIFRAKTQSFGNIFNCPGHYTFDIELYSPVYLIHRILAMHENVLSGIIIDICYEIHTTLGPGLLESVYEEVLCFELEARGIPFERQKAVPVIWKNLKMDIGFRPDVIISKKVLVEIKSVENIAKSHPKIVLTYIRLSNIKLGLLINFSAPLLKDGITRLVNHL
jgi:GxxExxY protein